MKKKTQRHSFKKLTTFSKRPDLKYMDLLNHSHDKYVKSSSKCKSSERVISTYESNRFKITKNAHNPRIKTEADEFRETKTPFQKLMQTKREKQSSRHKSSDKNKQFLETKHLNLKRLNLGLDICKEQYQIDDNIKNSSLEKSDAPHSGKYHSFRKAHESHRSGLKKTALQKYVSESLQNLELPKKKMNSSSKQHQLKSTLKKPHLDDLSTRTGKKSSREKKEFFRDEVTPKHAPLAAREYESHSKQKADKGEHDDSLEKVDLKWEKKRKNPYDLSKEEGDTFGDRFPDGFDKVKLLGRGGFSLVWLGEHKKSKKKYAIKQIITQSSHQTHIKQIWFGTYFFQFGGAPKQEFASSLGIKHLVKLYYYFINKKDTWILYQKCGDSLGNALYQLKSEQYNNQKMYRIHYKDFYLRIRHNQNQLRKVILDVAKALELLSENNIVHSDLKTENILVKLKTDDQIKENPSTSSSHILQTKLIDYGSSFVFNNLRQFSMATPEYMAPEVLNFILYQNEFEYIPKLLEYVQKYNNPWVIDVWSLGSVLLEIISGVPLWMSLKTIVKRKGQEVIRYGLFAIKGRAFDKIIKQQLEVIQNLDKYLYEENYSGIVLEEDLKVLLKRMLALNPAKRISPTEIIEYLNNSMK